MNTGQNAVSMHGAQCVIALISVNCAAQACHTLSVFRQTSVCLNIYVPQQLIFVYR